MATPLLLSFVIYPIWILHLLYFSLESALLQNLCFRCVPLTTDARLTIQFIPLPTFHLEVRRILVFLIKLPSFLKQIFHIYPFLEERYFYKKKLLVKNKGIRKDSFIHSVSIISSISKMSGCSKISPPEKHQVKILYFFRKLRESFNTCFNPQPVSSRRLIAEQNPAVLTSWQ